MIILIICEEEKAREKKISLPIIAYMLSAMLYKPPYNINIYSKTLH